MNFKRSMIATFVCASLAACGGSGDSKTTQEPTPEQKTTSLTARAADGYLIGAKACLDLNNNKECDADEPFAITGDNGGFTIEGVTQEQINSASILVEITENTKDQDYPEKTLKPYTLTAPAGAEFISPITTLIQNEIEKGSTIDEAKQAVKTKLGTTQDPTKDYIAGKNSTDLSAEEKAEFASLHRVAQVTATVIANQTEALKQAAQDKQISVEKLTTLIVEEVNKALQTIVEKVKVAEEKGEPIELAEIEKIATEVDDEQIDLSTDNLEDKVNENEAAKSATMINLGELIETEGIYWFSGEKHPDQQMVLDYGKLKQEADGSVIDIEYNLNKTMDGFELLQKDDEMNLQRMLTTAGWVREDDTITAVTPNDDGSIVLVAKTAALNEKVKAKQVDISGLNLTTVMSKVDGNGAWAKVLPKDATFPAGTLAYQVKSERAVGSYFSFNEGNWCDDERKAQLNGMCNGANIQTGDGSTEWVKSLDELVVDRTVDRLATKDTSKLSYMFGIKGAEASVEMVSGGELNFYGQKWGEKTLIKLGTGTWKDITVNGQTLRELTMPSTIASRDDFTWNDFNRDDNKAYLTVIDGFVRVVWHVKPDNADGEYIFNQAAQEFILSKFDYDLSHPATLANCLASLPDKDYQRKVGDKLEFNSQRAVAWVNNGDITNYHEIFTITKLDASWPNNENNLTDLPTWITAKAGKLEQISWSGFDTD